MIRLFVAYEAKIGAEIIYEDDTRPFDRYCQRLGVTAADEAELRNLVRRFAADSYLKGEVVDIFEMWTPDFHGSDAEVADLVGDMAKTGVWYSSGQAFFREGDAEEDYEIEEEDFDRPPN